MLVDGTTFELAQSHMPVNRLDLSVHKYNLCSAICRAVLDIRRSTKPFPVSRTGREGCGDFSPPLASGASVVGKVGTAVPLDSIHGDHTRDATTLFRTHIYRKHFAVSGCAYVYYDMNQRNRELETAPILECPFCKATELRPDGWRSLGLRLKCACCGFVIIG